MLGTIVIVLLVCLLIVILFFLFAKIQLCLESIPAKIQLQLRVGPIRILLYPKRENNKNARKIKNVKPVTVKGKAKQTSSESVSEPKEKTEKWKPSIDDLTQMLQEGIHLFQNSFSFDCLDCEMIFASEDAAKTGIMLGEASAAAGLLLPLLQSSFAIRKLRLILDADFQVKKSRWKVDIRIRTRVILILVLLLKKYKMIWRWYQMWKNNEKGKRYEQPSNQ